MLGELKERSAPRISIEIGCPIITNWQDILGLELSNYFL
jgi:hypothetical protein